MKPDELNSLVNSDGTGYLILPQNQAKTEEVQHIIFTQSNLTSDFQNDGSLGSLVLMDESVSMDEFKMSPATDALEYLLGNSSNQMSIQPQPSEEQIDPNALLVDLNELLRRDPNLSSLQDSSNSGDIASLNSVNTMSSLGMTIPKRNQIIVSHLNRGLSPNDLGSGLMAPPPSIASSFSNPLWTSIQVKQEPPMETEMRHSFGPGTIRIFPPSEQSASNFVPEVKMETQDFDLDALFLSSSSPNVSLGLGQAQRITDFSQMVNTLPNAPNVLKNMNFWQTEDFSWTGAQSPGSLSVDHKDLLSSSVPAAASAGPQLSPLSDYLSDISCSTNAGPALSPSQAGPQRNSSTLHKLLMKKETMRPVPMARSPDTRKTYERMRLSSQSSPLSQSAPTPERCLVERMWTRREPRSHFTSECSVGESSVTDEVNEIMGQMSPINQQEEEDEDEDDFDDEDESKIEEKDSSDESDDDCLGPLTGKSSGSKKERHFWQYNVQSKGPKGQKIVIQTKIDDPHVLNEIVDPVFSGDVQLQGIKHSGKARRGDGNDLTANPRKLAAIGKELESLGKEINDLTPLSEMPFGARCKSRKEKNKLASRACRLKKKAQHEANKLKLHGLQEEHRDLVNYLDLARKILLTKVDPTCSQSQAELTDQIDQLTKRALRNAVAGQTTEFVNNQIERNLPFV